MALALTLPPSAEKVPSTRPAARLAPSWDRFVCSLDMNLAPFRYQKIFRQDGGPIDHLERARVQTPRGLLFNVNAYLVDQLRPTRVATHQYYGNADGGGTHLTELVARFMAMSEAIERWAFWDCLDSPLRGLYGFDLEPTTTGMAAFPGMLHYRARRKARLEALERYALLHWWEGRLEHRVHRMPGDNYSVVELIVPNTSDKVVVTYADDAATGTRAYGYGAGTHLAAAAASAHGEMVRHQQVVARFIERHPSPELGLLAIDSHQERRALYFAFGDGKALFEERLRCDAWGREGAPRTVFDGLITGEWDRYATVWRTLYEPPSDEHLSDRNDYFFW